MATGELETRSDQNPVGPVTAPRFVSRRQNTPAGAVTIELLRHLHPSTLVLPDGGVLDPAAWHRHGQQGRDFVLVATCAAGASRGALGKLTLSVEDGEDGEGGDNAGQPVRRGTIERLFVHPHYRGLGIGTELVRAAIGFARDNGLAALRAVIPNLLALEEAAGGRHWTPYEPADDEFGGRRSLRVTARACVLEGQTCKVVGATRDQELSVSGDDRRERVGGILELPIESSHPLAPRAAEEVRATAVDLVVARLQAEVAVLAHVPWSTGVSMARA